MAPALGYLLFQIGAPLGLVNFVTGVGLSTFAAAALRAGLSLGLSYAVNRLTAPQQPRPSDGQLELKQPIPPRSSHYGRVKVAGALAFYESRSGKLTKDILLSARQIDAVEAYYINDNEVTIDETGAVLTKPFVKDGNHYARLQAQLGTDDQVANPLIADGYTEWTSDHRLRGIANIAARFGTPSADQFGSVFPNGEPAVAVLIRGSLLYDPRLDGSVSGGIGSHRHDDKSTWAWSENLGLAILDHLTHPDAYNRSITKIDLPSFMAYADLCDEDVPLAAGGTEKRYRIATTVTLTEARKDVLSRLLAAGDAELYSTRDGKIAIRGGKWVDPVVTLDHDLGHILQAKFSSPDALSRYTELVIQYLSGPLGYVEDEAAPWQDVDAIAATGILEGEPLDLSQVPSAPQARRLAKIKMARDSAPWIVELTTNLYGLNCIGERVIRLKYPELGIDGPFFIDRPPALSDDLTGLTLTLRS
ncbi:MAG: hypothetical protein J0H63_00630, partial [Rhizobiales bacterium]|nr:hypothetical protein [Hyphomicrobiales bacterium]